MTDQAPQPKQSTTAGKPVSALTMLIKYAYPVHKAGKQVQQFTFRGDQQQNFFSVTNQLTAICLTLHTEISKYDISEYAIYDNRPDAPAYPNNIIIQKIAGIIVHDSSSLYPDRVFQQLNKYKLI